MVGHKRGRKLGMAPLDSEGSTSAGNDRGGASMALLAMVNGSDFRWELKWGEVLSLSK